MKNLVKLKIILLVLSIFLATQSSAAERILPLPKPAVDEETKIKTAKKKEIYPQKKPKEKKEEIEIETTQKTIDTVEKIEEEIFIYPENKPITFKRKIDKSVAKSTILSKKDFKIAKTVFDAIDKKKVANSTKIIEKG